MMGRTVRQRGGFTLLELTLSLAVTALVGAATAAMLGSVSTGVFTQDDSRAVMLRANAARARLAAYVTPSRAMLDSGTDSLILWASDDRSSGTVHTSEVRWIFFDGVDGEIEVHYTSYPDGWTQTAIELADPEYAASADWGAIRDDLDTNGLIDVRPLVDGVDGMSVVTDEAAAIASQHVTFHIDFTTSSGADTVSVSAAIAEPQTPSDP